MGQKPPVTSVSAGAAALGLTMGGMSMLPGAGGGAARAQAAPAQPVRESNNCVRRYFLEILWCIFLPARFCQRHLLRICMAVRCIGGAGEFVQRSGCRPSFTCSIKYKISVVVPFLYLVMDAIDDVMADGAEQSEAPVPGLPTLRAQGERHQVGLSSD